jgi:hypothetical protein
VIPTLEAAGFFLAIMAALQFSSWAEKWLASNVRSGKERAPEPARSPAQVFSVPEHEMVRLA